MRGLRLGCSALAITLIFVGIFHHEAWRDEADVWLVVRDRSVGELVQLTRYMGHPSLWYLLVMPLAKAGLPYLSMFLLHGIVISLAIALLVFRSPLPDLLKLPIPFGYFFLFEYAIVARTYAISILLLFAIALVFHERERRSGLYGLLVLLLMSTNAYALLMGIALAALTAWEVAIEGRMRLSPALAAMGLGGLAAYLQLRPPPDGQIPDVLCHGLWCAPAQAIRSSFFPGYESAWASALGSVVLLSSVVWFWSRPKVFALGAMSYGLLALFYACKFGNAPRHFGFVLVFLVFLTWIMRGDESRPSAGGGEARVPELGRRLSFCAWSVSLVVSAVVGLRVWVDECERLFSTSRPMADFIEANVPPDAIVAAHPHVIAESVLAYLTSRSEFYYPSRRALGSHMSWDRNYVREANLPKAKALRVLFETLGDEGREVYFLTNDIVRRPGLELVAAMDRRDLMAIGHDEEVFRLYRWKRPVDRGALRSGVTAITELLARNPIMRLPWLSSSRP